MYEEEREDAEENKQTTTSPIGQKRLLTEETDRAKEQEERHEGISLTQKLDDMIFKDPQQEEDHSRTRCHQHTLQQHRQPNHPRLHNHPYQTKQQQQQQLQQLPRRVSPKYSSSSCST